MPGIIGCVVHRESAHLSHYYSYSRPRKKAAIMMFHRCVLVMLTFVFCIVAASPVLVGVESAPVRNNESAGDSTSLLAALSSKDKPLQALPLGDATETFQEIPSSSAMQTRTSFLNIFKKYSGWSSSTLSTRSSMPLRRRFVRVARRRHPVCLPLSANLTGSDLSSSVN
ncbi:hypothetical protein BDZ97DRAFT_1101230 [Flammula alnicola]|nr:hypothetical protein BDZ97DRAFT_1101230 [Flammula alnicola]